jgi:hypothetical protein
MKKIIYFSVLLCLITSCNTSETNEVIFAEYITENTLVIKEIITEELNRTVVSVFDDTGKIVRKDYNVSNYFHTRFRYNASNEMTSITEESMEIFGWTYFYNDNVLNSYNFHYFRLAPIQHLVVTEENSSSLDYHNFNGELLTLTITYEQKELYSLKKYSLYKKIKSYSTFNNTQNKYKNIVDLEYDDFNNLIEVNQKIKNYGTINYISQFTYDNQKNALHDRMSSYLLPFILSRSTSSDYMITKIIEFSPNNILTNSKSNEIYSYRYNEDYYPISSEVKIDGNIIETKSFTYY